MISLAIFGFSHIIEYNIKLDKVSSNIIHYNDIHKYDLAIVEINKPIDMITSYNINLINNGVANHHVSKEAQLAFANALYETGDKDLAFKNYIDALDYSYVELIILKRLFDNNNKEFLYEIFN